MIAIIAVSVAIIVVVFDACIVEMLILVIVVAAVIVAAVRSIVAIVDAVEIVRITLEKKLDPSPSFHTPNPSLSLVSSPPKSSPAVDCSVVVFAAVVDVVVLFTVAIVVVGMVLSPHHPKKKTRSTSAVSYPQLIIFSCTLPPKSSPAIDCSVFVVAVVVVVAVRLIVMAIVVVVNVALSPSQKNLSLWSF
jgi:hypothetical protein